MYTHNFYVLIYFFSVGNAVPILIMLCVEYAVG